MKNKQAGRPGHDETTKRAAVLESRAPGTTVVNVAKKYSVSANTLQNWRKAYPQTGALTSPRTRITQARRTTVAVGNGNAELIQMLKQELATVRAENRILRDIFFEQEFKHRGYTPSGIQAAQTIIPETIRPNGALSATN
jgi:transposase-like protein